MMKKILYIEDDEASQFVLEMLFDDKGFEFHTASDADEGLMLAEKLSPDLIIVDIQLPGQNGLALIDTMRATPKFKDTPFIVLSAQVVSEGIRKRFETEGVEFARKPIQIANFHCSVLKFLGS